MRKLPNPPQGEVKLDPYKDPKGNAVIRQERKYELITPLFGGGVEAGKNDPITLISGKAIRGHLRFWWRATRGGQFNGDLGKMKEREAEIWGAASTPDKPSPSKVKIEISEISRTGNEDPYIGKGRVNEGWKDLAYAAFPFQDNPQSVATGVRFKLIISFPEKIKDENGTDTTIKDEIEAALWAWETFGGIGARTRRGFGALLCANSEAFPANPEKIQERIKEKLMKYVAKGEWPSGVPHLSADMSLVIVGKKEKASAAKRAAYKTRDEAWEDLIKELKSFRQARSGNYGRSKWPEPEKIRRVTNQRFPKHSEDSNLKSINGFPRAVFGLPILFQFKRDQKNQTPPYSDKLDPIDTTLKGETISSDKNKYRERLASPLILRPLACGNNQGIGLAAILKTERQPPEGLVLKGDGLEEKASTKLTKKEALKIEPLKAAASKLANDDDEIDVLEAFLDRFRA